MSMLPSLLTLPLLACGAQTLDEYAATVSTAPTHHCDAPCTRGVDSVHPMRCSTAAVNVQQARDAFAKHWGMDAETFCDEFSHVRVEVARGDSIVAAGRRAAGKYQDWGRTVLLEEDGAAWAHELIHAYETRRDIPTDNHEEWDVRGNWALADEFAATHTPLWSGQGL
jgi:hypothetical protein